MLEAILTAALPVCKMCAGETRRYYHLSHNSEPCDLLECTACGFHFIDYIDDATVAATLLEEGEEFATQVFELESNQERTARNLALLRSAVPRPGRLLDVGCGAGVFLVKAQASGWAAKGIELDPRLARTARARGLAVREQTLEG